MEVEDDGRSMPTSNISQLISTEDLRADAAARLFTPLRAAQREIRLLAVHPGEPSEPIHCSLLYTSLLGEPTLPYETVSYCWGSIQERSNIRVEGELLNVAASSAEALRRLRRFNTSRILWIDAVCINQYNLEEKGRQVAFMGEVYSKAVRNLIWLGEADDLTEQALGAIRSIVEDARIETEDFRTLPQTAYDEHGAYVVSTSPLNASFESAPLQAFFNRPWFHRLWVVQEATLANWSICHCGPHEVALADILRTAQWLFYKQRFLDFQIFENRGIVNAARVWEFADHEYGWLHSEENRPTEFRPLLHALRDFDTYDPKDHVFGVLGLYQVLVGTAMLPRGLIPDYNRSTTEVLESATLFAIEERGDLDVFSSLLHWPSEPDYGFQLASWVPRWNRPVENDRDALRLAFFFRADNGISLSRDGLVDLTLDRILILRGFVVDKISQVGSIVKPTDTRDRGALMKLFEEVRALFGRRFGDGSVPLPNDTIAFATTLVAGRNSARRPFTETDLPEYVAFADSLNRGVEAVIDDQVVNLPFGAETDEDRRSLRYLQAFREACTDRRFFVGSMGYFGLGPSTTQSDDLVCILYGSRWPVILRLVEGHYQILGITYTHSIMHGEAITSLNADGKQDRVFRVQ